MASLGDALLGIAGGAAEAYSAEVQKRAESDRKMIENTNNLLTASRIRVQETKALNDYQTAVKNDDVRNYIKSIPGGADSLVAQFHYATTVQGMDPKKAEEYLGGGGTLPIPKSFMQPSPQQSYQPSGVFDELAAGMQTARGKARVADMREKYQGYRPPMTDNERLNLNFDIPESIHQKDQERIKGEQEKQRQIFQSLPELQGVEGLQIMNLMKLEQAVERNPENPLYVSALEDYKKLIGKSKDKLVTAQGTTTVDGVSRDTLYVFRDDGKKYTKLQSFDLGLSSEGEQAELSRSADQQLYDLKGKSGRIAETREYLTNLMITRSPSTGSLPAFFTDVVGYINNSVSGFAELAGVNPETTADQLRGMYKEAGADYDAVMENLGKSSSYFKGSDRVIYGTLVYSLANYYRDLGGRKDTNQSDIERADRVLANLKPDKTGKGAYAELMHVLNTRYAMQQQDIYQIPGISKEERAAAGIELFKVINPDAENVEGILYAQNDGEVLIFNSPEHKQTFLQLRKQMPAGKTWADLMQEARKANLAPATLTQAIQKYAKAGKYWTPRRDPERYIRQLTETEPRR